MPCFNPLAMSKVCDICEKGSLKGNLVKRGIGRRVTRRTIMHQEPNLFTKRIQFEGNTLKVKICASCLKRFKFELDKLEKSKGADTKTAPSSA